MPLWPDMVKLLGHLGLKEEDRVLFRNGILIITSMLLLYSMVYKTEINTRQKHYKNS